MKLKKEYPILAAVIIALSLYLILRRTDRTEYALPELPKVHGTDLSKIEISKQDTSIVLSKKDNRWHIAPRGYPADTEKVKGMIDAIEELTLTALVSESRDYTRYGLNDDQKIKVRAWAGNSLRREFEVGKAAPSYRHTFVKLAGDDRVYHARGNFRGSFDRTVESLRDKTVLAFAQGEIQEIHITKGLQTMLIGLKQEPVKIQAGQESKASGPSAGTAKALWQTADGKAVDASKLNPLLSTLSHLQCEKYLDDLKKEDLVNPVYTLSLKGAKDYLLSVFPKKDKEAKSYPAVSSESDYPFLLSDRQTEKIMIDPEEMLKKPEK